MLQVPPHRHGDLISLSSRQNARMDSIDERKERERQHRAEHREALGKRVASLRERAGFSRQGDLAEAASIRQPSLSAIESGKTQEVTARVLIALARALGTTVDHVWDGSDRSEEDAANEAELIATYRVLPPPGKTALMQSSKSLRSAFKPDDSGGPKLTVVASTPEIPHLPEANFGKVARKTKKKKRS